MFWLQFAAKIIRVLREGASPKAIAGGFTFGFVIGLIPLFTLQNLILLVIAAIIRVNIATLGLGVLVFSFIAYVFDPVLHDVGYYFLTEIGFLQGFYIYLYNLPVAPLTRFNNTVVMGSMIIGIAASPFVFWLSKKGIEQYRSRWAEKVHNNRFIKFAKGTKVIQLYVKLRSMDF